MCGYIQLDLEKVPDDKTGLDILDRHATLAAGSTQKIDNFYLNVLKVKVITEHVFPLPTLWGGLTAPLLISCPLSAVIKLAML